MAGVVAGALLLAGLGTFLLVRRSAREEARRELVTQAQQLATATVRGVERGTGYLLVSSALALLVAALVAQYLARRIVRPLKEAEQATKRIAEGDLAARVPVGPDDYRELASLTRSINTMAASL